MERGEEKKTEEELQKSENSEEAFCSEYRKAQESFFKSRSEESAVDLVMLNTEEYGALGVLKEALDRKMGETGGSRPESEERETPPAQKQFDMTTALLQKNPKSYGVWYHRIFVKKRRDIEADREIDSKPDSELDLDSSKGRRDSSEVKEELKKHAKKQLKKNDMRCAREVLERDGRNFHCWGYLKKAYGYPLDLISEEISKSSRNYSAYHALLESGRADEMEEKDVERAVKSDPDAGAPWVFLSSKLELERFSGGNAYLKVYADRICVVLRVPCPAKIEIAFKKKRASLEYSAEYKKNVFIHCAKDGYATEEIEKISIVSEKKEKTVILLEKERTEKTPSFFESLTEKSEKTQAGDKNRAGYLQAAMKNNLDALILATEYLKGPERSKMLSILLEIDPTRTTMYQDMQEEYKIYTRTAPNE